MLPGDVAAWAKAAEKVVGPTEGKWFRCGDGATPNPRRSESKIDRTVKIMFLTTRM